MSGMLNEKIARTIVEGVEQKHQMASIMLGFGKIEPGDYNRAEGFLAGLQVERDRARGLVEAVEKLITQFKVIQMHQHRLLIRGQNLESAGKNWNEATEMQSFDLEPLMKEVEAYRAGGGKP